MKRFKTLLQREWMQHHRGWLILLALPMMLVVGIAAFASFQFELDEGPADALGATMLLGAGLTALTLGLAWGATLLMSPGLARRDVQDRSIEFWVSLPIPHSHSVGAMLLMHLLALPLAAVLVGLLGAVVLSPLVVAEGWGIGQWFTLPWGDLLLAAVALAMRLWLGIVLVTLWLSPLIIGTMAASAWLKRWGVPAVVGGLTIGGVLMEKFYGITIIGDTLKYLFAEAATAGIAAVGGGEVKVNHPNELHDMLPMAPGWMMHDAGQALLALATPGFVATVLVGAAMFGLLVWRRARGQ